MRQVIISILGILIIGGGYLGYKSLAATERPQREKPKKASSKVFTQIVKNEDTPITVKASGNLAAKERIEIYSEVQGIFEHSDQAFKPGVSYNGGEVLIRLNSAEERASLLSQKSNLQNLLVGILPEMRFDYPDAFEKWQAYVNNFDVNSPLRPLPQTTLEREKLFIAGQNIITNWYNVKNIEERMTKYSIYAPYNGVLTEASINIGSLVRVGQKLGEFINPNVYELEVAVNSTYADLLKRGSNVIVQNVERTKTWKGRVTRINDLIDPNTQTIQAFIQVTGKGLREGMYLEAVLQAKNENNTFEISRKLLVDNSKVFVYNDGKLNLRKIDPVHYTDKTVVIRGLEDETEILERMLPGAFDGMPVERFDEKK
jgi:multidrug efflux pump subunit AcrA (membrane-fusion protein)